MEIIKVKIEDIKEYENNAKLHPTEQIEQIKKSIKEFGNNDPIAIDENNTIIEGHGRYKALKELGYKEVECIKLDHMTEEQKKAYILVHNKLNMNTGFDFELLDKEMSEILDIDMSDYGFVVFEPMQEIDESDLDDEREKTEINVTLRFDDFQSWQEIKERVENLTEEANGRLSIKMV